MNPTSDTDTEFIYNGNLHFPFLIPNPKGETAC
jgi:hypothetical protein